MLQFEKHPDFYRIIEKTFSFNKTYVKIVDYSLDLSLKRCNNESYRKTTEADRNWFEKYYRKKFKAKTIDNNDLKAYNKDEKEN